MRCRNAVWLAVVMEGLLASVLMAAPPRPTAAKATPRGLLALERDYISSLDGNQSVLQPGKVVTVQLQSGKTYENLEIANVQLAKQENRFRQLTFKPGKGTPTKIAPGTLYQLRTAERTYDVLTDPMAKAWVLLDLTQRNEVAERRLQARGHELWKPPTDDEIREATDYYEDLFAKARAQFPNLTFQRIETEYFVFFTDMPPAQVAGYIANLDTMYQQLCLIFGIPQGTNIWVGKCPILAFVHKEAFQQFESVHMGTDFDGKSIMGLNHQSSNGHVITTCYRGDNPTYFAVVLVHETSHGFLHRIRSNNSIPPWMDEGIAEWVASVVVPQSQHIANKMSDALPRIRQSGHLGGDFLDDEGFLDGWQYGVAATLTQYMINTDPNAYRALITGIKEGYSWQEALELTYGMTADQLAAAYGQQIGVPGLRP